MVLCLSRIAATACIVLLGPSALATQTPETKPLHVLVDGRDGLPVGGTGPADARTDPDLLRFWVGHGLSLGQIQIDDRARQFDEEAEQPYQNEIARVIFDEGTTTSGAHRLYVLTVAQRNSTPPRPGTVYLLDATFPDSVSELHSYDLVDTSTPSPDPVWEYGISDIAQLPGTDWIVGVGTATLGSTKELLVLLFERQVNLGQEELVLIAESRSSKIQLYNDCPAAINPLQPLRYMTALGTAVVHDYGAFFGLFAIGNVDPAGRGIRGVASIKLDPTATLPADRIVWPTGPEHIFDPLLWAICDVEIPAPGAGFDWTSISVSAGVVVDPAVAPASPSPQLYLAAGRLLQVIEVDVSEVFDFVSGNSGDLIGFDYGQAVSLKPEPVTDNETNLHWIAHTDEGNADLLFATGDNAIYCFKRTDPSQSGRTWQKFNEPPVTGHLMRENLGAGDRYHLWTVCYDTPSPWTVFDVTDRTLNPGVFPPDRLETRYLPAGTDGAVAIPEWESVYATNFGGLVRYDWSYDFEDEVHSLVPDYSSYQPAVVNDVSYVTEQVEYGELSPTDRRIFAPTGNGQILQWVLDPLTKNPGPPSLVPIGGWGPAAGGYSHRVTFGRCSQRDRPFLLVDLALDLPGTASDVLELGRYWFPVEGPLTGAYANQLEWETIDLRLLDCHNLISGWIWDIAISADSRWAAVSANNGFVVVDLHGCVVEYPCHPTDWEPSFWSVVDAVYTSPTPTVQPPDPCADAGFAEFQSGRVYVKVEGVAFQDSYILASLSSSQGGAIAFFLMDPSVDHCAWACPEGTPATPRQVLPVLLEVQSSFVDPATQEPFDLAIGGAVRTFAVEPHLARVYATDNQLGAVLEFELDGRGTTPTLTLLSRWQANSHFSQTPDARPYDVEHPSGLPAVLVSRYRQTVAVLAADGMIEEPEEP